MTSDLQNPRTPSRFDILFSQTTEYALRVMIHLASLSRPATTREIAVATKVPVGYLSKVIQSLSRAGLIVSQRGLHGGSALARPPKHITIYDVVQVTEPIKRIKTCPLGLKSHGVNLCPLHRRMDQALDHVERAFRQSTLQDLLDEPTTSKPLCEPPRAKRVPLTISGKK
jgi:Rrf2 family protein